MRHFLAIRRDGACKSFPRGSASAQDGAAGGGSLLPRVAARLRASASASLTGRRPKRSMAACAMLLAASVLLCPNDSFALQVVGQFAFSDRFPGTAKHLDFVTGTSLGVGAFVTPTSGVPVTESTATNLSTGVQLNLVSASLPVLPGLYQVLPAPEFDADLHLGVWEIRVKDSAGTEVVVTTAPIDHREAIPYVKRLAATGDPLAPSITWDAPKAQDIPTSCTMGYRVRLLFERTRQIYISPNLTTTSFVVPPGVIRAEDVDELRVRMEALCNEPGGTDSRSNTFRPLQDLLEGAE